MLQFGFLLSWLIVNSLADFVAPRYKVNLDAKPEDRWAPIFEDVINKHGWNHSFGPMIDFMTDIVPMEDWIRYDLIIQAVGMYLFDAEYYKELNGVYALVEKLGLQDKVTRSMLIFFQLFYELLMECTGIVANRPDGVVMHGRNMDLPAPLQNITVTLTWVKGGKNQLITSQFLGYLGVHTGMRLDGWSVEANMRVILSPRGPLNYKTSVVVSDLLALVQHHPTVGYLLRKTLLSHPTFEDAVTELSGAPSVSPLYFIMAGAGHEEGAVLTKNRNGLAHSPHGESIRRLSGVSAYYLVQTNWDNWMPITKKQCNGTVAAFPAYVQMACAKFLQWFVGGTGNSCDELCQLASDGRQEAAEALMDKKNPGLVSNDVLLEVLSDPGVIQDITVFTSLMSPAMGSYTTIVRDHKGPIRLQKESKETMRDLFHGLVDLASKLNLFHVTV